LQRYANQSDISITGHRGASGLAPENTILAIDLAVSYHANSVEFDIQMTADGIFVLFHDQTLQRICQRPEQIGQLSFHELEQLDAGNWFHPSFKGTPIPALNDVLYLYQHVLTFNIELKIFGDESDTVHKLVADLRSLPALPSFFITSFHHHAVIELKTQFPELSVGWIFDRPVEAWELTDSRIDHISIDQRFVDSAMVEQCRRANKKLHVWTVNETSEMERCIALGVDSIITNYPNILWQLMQSNDHQEQDSDAPIK
jgi:glycerophosphoryl diester phosphodiesterase